MSTVHNFNSWLWRTGRGGGERKGRRSEGGEEWEGKRTRIERRDTLLMHNEVLVGL